MPRQSLLVKVSARLGGFPKPILAGADKVRRRFLQQAVTGGPGERVAGGHGVYVFSVSGTMKPSAQVRVSRSGRVPSVRAFPCSRASVFSLSSSRRFKMRSRRPQYTSSGVTLPRASWCRSVSLRRRKRRHCGRWAMPLERLGRTGRPCASRRHGKKPFDRRPEMVYTAAIEDDVGMSALPGGGPGGADPKTRTRRPGSPVLCIGIWLGFCRSMGYREDRPWRRAERGFASGRAEPQFSPNSGTRPPQGGQSDSAAHTEFTCCNHRFAAHWGKRGNGLRKRFTRCRRVLYGELLVWQRDIAVWFGTLCDSVQLPHMA